MSQIKSLIKITMRLALIGSSVFFLQSCSGSKKKPGDLAICNPQYKMRALLSSPFDENKVQLPQIYSKDQNTEISLALVVNTSCIHSLDTPLYVLGQKVVVPEELSDLNQVALSLTVTDPIDQDQLAKDMDQSPCLIGIAEDKPVELDSVEEGGDTDLIQKNLNDPKASEQHHLEFLHHSKSLEIQNHITEQVIIAVLDTGINENHPELLRRMWDGILGNHGKDFTRTSRPSPSDDDGQGTHIAGIMAAQQNNDYGVAGLLGGFVRLMSVKVLGGSRSKSKESSVFNGIQFAINRGADVINLSLGEDRVNVLTVAGVLGAVNKGALFSIAAGNDASLLTGTRHRFPASVGSNIGGAITVASVDTHDGQLSSFSNYSSEYVELAAPGAERSYGSPRKFGILSTDINGGYSRLRGTSMSAAMVSAAAALLIGYFKTNEISYTPAGVERTLLTSGSRSVSDLRTKVRGGRVLDFGSLVDGINSIADCK